MLYTSGTTGRSKGAMLTHANLESNAVALHEIWRFAPDDVLLHTLPIFHVHGLFVALHSAMLSGAPVIFLPRFDVDEVLQHLPEATVMMGVPTQYTRLLADDRFDASVCASIRLFTSGSAPMTAPVHAEFTARTGHRILDRPAARRSCRRRDAKGTTLTIGHDSRTDRMEQLMSGSSVGVAVPFLCGRPRDAGRLSRAARWLRAVREARGSPRRRSARLQAAQGPAGSSRRRRQTA